jgi:DNA-binding transcriptional regulator YiaG
MKARKKTPARRKPSAAAIAKGKEIIASLTELVEAVEAGVPLESRFTVRTAEAPDPPAAYDGKTVRATREKIGASQALFASVLGVSAALVQSWEQGNRRPAVWARRLLDEVNRDPVHWRGMLRKAS